MEGGVVEEPSFASATSEAAVFGALLVECDLEVAAARLDDEHVRRASSSGVEGFVAPPSAFASGASTSAQPSAVVDSLPPRRVATAARGGRAGDEDEAYERDVWREQVELQHPTEEEGAEDWFHLCLTTQGRGAGKILEGRESTDYRSGKTGDFLP